MGSLTGTSRVARTSSFPSRRPGTGGHPGDSGSRRSGGSCGGPERRPGPGEDSGRTETGSRPKTLLRQTGVDRNGPRVGSRDDTGCPPTSGTPCTRSSTVLTLGSLIVSFLGFPCTAYVPTDTHTSGDVHLYVRNPTPDPTHSCLWGPSGESREPVTFYKSLSQNRRRQEGSLFLVHRKKK